MKMIISVFRRQWLSAFLLLVLLVSLPSLLSAQSKHYTVQPGETLNGLANRHGVTAAEILKLNPSLTNADYVQAGQTLVMPNSSVEKEVYHPATTTTATSTTVQGSSLTKTLEETSSKKNLHQLNVAVVLPLKEGGDRGDKMVEFYQGILMAADSVKSKGITVDMYAYHCGSTYTEIKYILSKPELKQMDVIFGPLDAAQASEMALFCYQNKIRLVMPFSTTNTYGQNFSCVYQASGTGEAVRTIAADMVAGHFTNANYVLLKSGAADQRGSQFTEEIRSQLADRGVKMKVLIMEGDEFAYSSVLSKTAENIIIPDASSLQTTTEVCHTLRNYMKQHPEFQLTLVGYPEWPTYANSLLMDFYALNTYCYSTFYRNPSEGRVSLFEARFKNNFKKSMAHTYPRYGMMGFDLGYYFLNGLSKLGDNFEKQQNDLIYRPYQNGYRFLQSASGAYTNQYISLVHYTTSQRVDVVR